MADIEPASITVPVKRAINGRNPKVQGNISVWVLADNRE
jgi:hypothetical protein